MEMLLAAVFVVLFCASIAYTIFAGGFVIYFIVTEFRLFHRWIDRRLDGIK